MKKLKRGQHVRHEEYVLSYVHPDESGVGYAFPCTKDGVLLPLEPPAQENYERCLRGDDGLTFDGIKDWSWTSYEPPVIECDCGRKLVLYHPATNECDCGRLYNGVGQQLAPRRQWEWEGENDVAPEDWYAL